MNKLEERRERREALLEKRKRLREDIGEMKRDLIIVEDELKDINSEIRELREEELELTEEENVQHEITNKQKRKKKHGNEELNGFNVREKKRQKRLEKSRKVFEQEKDLNEVGEQQTELM